MKENEREWERTGENEREWERMGENGRTRENGRERKILYDTFIYKQAV